MKHAIIPYSPHLREQARKLRNNATFSEVLLWKHLKGKQMLGYDFHRQRPVSEFIVDFYCAELRLAIEVDGCSHNGRLVADELRQNRLESLGVRVLRFLDTDMRGNVEGVVMEIQEWIREHTPAPPPAGPPLSRGEKKRCHHSRQGKKKRYHHSRRGTR